MLENNLMCRIECYKNEDRGKLDKFFAEVWTPPPLAKSTLWFDWIVSVDPNASLLNPSLLLALVDERIVGILVLVPTPLWVDGEIYDVAWGRDLFVNPEYRRHKFGLLLVEYWTNAFKAALGSGQSSTMRNLQQKHGWTEIARVKQYEKLFFNVQVLRESINDGVVKLCKRTIAMLYARFMTPKFSRRSNCTVSRRSEFDPRVDVLWVDCRKEYSRICSRDYKTLQWRFTEHPYFSYTIFEIIANDGSYNGYLVTRQDGDTCWLIDLLTRKKDHASRTALIGEAEIYFLSVGITRFICRSVCVELESALQAIGYLPTKFEQFFCIKTNNDLPAGNREQWFVTAMDSDLDR